MSKKKKTQKKKTTLSLNSVLEKQVVDSSGEIIGSVKDIIVTIGGEKPEALLLIKNEEGKETQVSFTDVSAISEVVLLSKDMLSGKDFVKPAGAFTAAEPKKVTTVPTPPPPPTVTATNKCPGCGFENRPDSKFCIKCGNKLT